MTLDIVTILVGPDEKSFIVHKAFISETSAFFQAANSGKRIKATEKIIRLPEAEVGIFDVYLHWIYISELHDRFTSFPPPDRISPHNIEMAKLWIFADEVQNHKLCNSVVDMIIKVFDLEYDMTDADTLNYVWQNTSSDSKLRRLHADTCSSTLKPSELDMPGAKWPQEVIMTFAKGFVAGEKAKVMETCEIDNAFCCERYHTHSGGQKCTN